MKHRRALIVAAVLFSVARIEAQSTASEAPASKEDIQRLFVVMNVRQQMAQVMDDMVKEQSQMMRDSLKRRSPRISDAEIQHLDQAMHELMKEFPYAAMLNDMIPVYQKHLSKTDVAAMTAFYSSPTGKKLLRDMPAMTTESMQAAYPTMQAYMEKVMNQIDARAKEDKQRTVPPANKN